MAADVGKETAGLKASPVENSHDSSVLPIQNILERKPRSSNVLLYKLSKLNFEDESIHMKTPPVTKGEK